MPEDAQAQGGGGRIGPNAVLQLVPVLRAEGGDRLLQVLMQAAGLPALPPDDGLMAEAPARRLHQALRRQMPDRAALIARAAGQGTADYILAHRIPPRAQKVLRLLPRPLAMRALTRAIARHAWTFAGSGAFSTPGPGRFRIAANPLVLGETASAPVCHWHVAVFERLFRSLVDDRLRCVETSCCACGDLACRFDLYIRA